MRRFIKNVAGCVKFSEAENKDTDHAPETIDRWIAHCRMLLARNPEPDTYRAEAIVDGRNGLADFIGAALAVGVPMSDKARGEILQSLPHLRGQMGSRLWADEVTRVSDALCPKKD